ncbi:T9SS type A sorting domain-containing protein [Halocola ammonii]
MRQLTFCIATFFLTLFSLPVLAQGDTVVVQTYTFEEQNNPETAYDSPGRRWFDFPEDDGTEYQKILMYYTLKCFEDGTAGGLGFPCGEWDYTTHTYLYEHTGALDSNALQHPLYLANNMDFEEMEFSEIPLVNTYNYEFSETVVSNVISEAEYSINSDMTQALDLSSGIPAKVQFYYSADELTTAGLQNEIQKISLMLDGEAELSNFSLKVSWMDEAPIELVDEDLVEVFFHPAFSFTSGQTDIFLDNTIEWDNTSGLLMEISFDSASAGFQILGAQEGNSFQASDGDNQYILLDGQDQVQIPASLFEGVDEEITIGYWLYGTPEFQPENSSTFEGVNANNDRVLNVHNPWGNGQVYWDAGNEGGYDRINAQASESEYEGQWNHWAFTKNTTTGEMRIFLNGEEWLFGADKDNSMAGITQFVIGSAASGVNYYRGGMDDFFILDKELTVSEIQEYMNSSYSGTLPQSENLLAYFEFEDVYGEPVTNSAGELHGLAVGNAALLNYSGEELNGSEEVTVKPWLSLFSGEYETTEATVNYQVIEELPPISVVEYGVNGNQLEVVSTESLYPVGFSNEYDVNGDVINSVSNSMSEPLIYVNDTLNYFSPPFEVINRIELGRFITPYGINLDMEDGWTWVYDVTDFEPLLRGEVELEAGNWQELLDLKFLFIEGTPPRDVKSVQNVWAGNYQLSIWNDNVPEKSFTVNEGDEMFKLRATTSGHFFGQGNNCAEFCFNTHDLKVNGNNEYSWQMIQECADNPLYPQGGTWIYDRAGWCPGAPVTTREFELTPFIEGNEFTLEYDIDYDPYGNYWLMAQLISYGEINHAVDVDMTEIISPSDFKINSRVNPICDNPMIRITNQGSEPLTSLDIEYGVNGQMQTYNWTGDLEFMESEVITLTYDETDEFYWGDNEEMLTFEVQLSAPNGTVDENQSNNYNSSHFVRPPTYAYDEDEDDNRIIVITKTNNIPSETDVTLKTIDGTTIWTSDYTQANFEYKDTLTLNAGCYFLHIEDSGDDGLSFFANNDGSGYVRLKKVGGLFFEFFERDFGKEIRHYFNFQTDIISEVEEYAEEPSISIYPNPSSDRFYLRGNKLIGDLDIQVYDGSGKLVQEMSRRLTSSSDRVEIDISDQTDGIYNVIVRSKSDSYSKRIIKN